jgi:UDP-N-acetylenolpyruvoylglucosamine reductase
MYKPQCVMEHDERIRALLVRRVTRVDENVSAARLNALALGGRFRWVVTVHSAGDLARALQAGEEAGLPCLVLGRGHHTLIPTEGFAGLVIMNETTSLMLAQEHTLLLTDAGVLLDRCVTQTASAGLAGLAPWFGSGRTVGSALMQDLEVGGVGLHQRVKSLTVYVPARRAGERGEVVQLPGTWLRQPDGTATLPALWPRPTILTATFQLTRQRPQGIMRQMQPVPHMPRLTWGPLFQAPGGGPVEPFLESAGILGLRIGSAEFTKKYPNTVTTHRPVGMLESLRPGNLGKVSALLSPEGSA